MLPVVLTLPLLCALPGGGAGFVRAGDTALGAGSPLSYGRSTSVGNLRCDGVESAITCRDGQTDHGFSLSREAYRIF